MEEQLSPLQEVVLCLIDSLQDEDVDVQGSIQESLKVIAKDNVVLVTSTLFATFRDKKVGERHELVLLNLLSEVLWLRVEREELDVDSARELASWLVEDAALKLESVSI
jgi:hypothetical protein